ncbi:hypothetical protein M0R19_00185 [Candidatus Pacearchaeota archaeon]|jgi:hypothetical protein|nr:hypothetical protein [Candidatus Pacearchaeota archaeon]
MNNKRADITTQQIVILIILITSFVVILIFLFALNFGKTSEKEICHNSVVTRGTNVLPGESIPLNCKTSYICITKDGTCEKMSGTYEKKTAKKTKEEVYSILANEMADCWWIFGEGKINYVGKDFKSDLYCSICSQISFDNSLDMFENGEIDKKLFYNYLAKTNVSGKDTSYLEYLNGLASADAIEASLKNSNNSEFGKINLAKQYYVIMGIFSETGVGQWTLSGAGAGMAVGLVVGGPIGVVIGGIVGGVGGHFVATIVKGDSKNNYLSPEIVEANSEDFEKLRCASIKTLG